MRPAGRAPTSESLEAMHAIRVVAAMLALGPCVPAASAQTPITIQVVNDSGLADSQVFLLLGGQDVTDANKVVHSFSASGIPTVNTAGAVTQAVQAAPLVCPTPPGACTGFAQALDAAGMGLTVDSPYSGTKGLNVYQFTVTTAGSGTLYASYGTPLRYLEAPTVTSNLRFQSVEFTYSQFVTSTADLTSIDFFGIPIQMQTYAAGDTTFASPVDYVTYYTSTPTLLDAFTRAHPHLKYAFMRTDGMPFDPAADSMSDFARIVGPNQIAAPGGSPLQLPASKPTGYGGAWPPAQGSPWPYPSFADYLDSLVAAGYTFRENDAAVISAYTFDYTGTITGNRANGWNIVLAGTTSAPPPLPSNATITIPLPAQGNTNGGADFVIYGAPQSCDSLVVAGFDCDGTTLTQISNSVYGWIQADVLSALNFGYMNGSLDAAYAQYNPNRQVIGNSSLWYNLPPVPYPFGQARSVNDGYYNVWAALMYNHSDAYGFAFSDRNGRPSPGIGMPVGGTIRLWLLPDKRLDAPIVQASAGDASISLAWPRVPGADHYVVRWSPPFATTSAHVPQPAASQALVTYSVTDGIAGGTPYTITVRAHNADGTRSSAELPVYATTSGSPPKRAAGSADFVWGFNWVAPAYPQLPPSTPVVSAATNAPFVVAAVASGMLTMYGDSPGIQWP
jgi:hypothetical protein